MIPNEEKLGPTILKVSAYEQYQRRLALMKNIRGKNQDVHNYWHHLVTLTGTFLTAGGLRLQVTAWIRTPRTTMWQIIS